MSVFANTSINRAYLQGALRSLAEKAGGVFALAYLLKSGVPAPVVFCAMAATVTIRFMLRPGVLPLAQRIGLRNVVVVGTLLESLGCVIVPFIDGLGPMLIAYIVANALGSVVFWTSYHAWISAQGDADRRGGQIGTLLAVQGLVGIFAPALGGFALAGGRSYLAFGGAAVIHALSAAPLLGAPNVAVLHDNPIDAESARFARRLYFVDGWYVACAGTVWQVALFVTLGERFGAYGGAMALMGVVSALMGVAMGRLIDLGHGLRAIKIAYSAGGVIVALRALGFGAPVAAVTANTLSAVSSALLGPAFLAPAYNAAKRSGCPLRFYMVAESGWDLGFAAASLIAAALIASGVSYSLPIAMAFFGIGFGYWLLRERCLAETGEQRGEVGATVETG